MTHYLLDSYSRGQGTSVAIGVFDGVHLGHQSVLTRCKSFAATAGLRAVCLTFDPHPARILAPEHAPLSISSLNQRIELIERLALADDVVVVPFTRELANLSAEQFVESILVGKLNVKQVCVGADFRYGKSRTGSVMDLESAGDSLGFDVSIVHALAHEGHRISSTEVRTKISQGGVRAANQLLGRDFSVRGKIVHGKHLGRTIGYPTINVEPSELTQILPADGVYAGYTTILSSGQRVRSAISVGTNPTTDTGTVRHLEAFLMDGFDSDIYNEEVDIEFTIRLREQRQYDSIDKLVSQIEIDVTDVTKLIPSPV